jgi:hypothetical protein
MTTYKTIHDRENPYALISLEVLRDPTLSGKAIRLLIYLLSMPPGWQPNPRHLAKQLKEGTYAITTAIAELKERGFLVCRRLRDTAGRLIGSEWDINEKPIAQNTERKDVHGNIIKVVKDSTKVNRKTTASRSPDRKAPPETQAKSVDLVSFSPYLENPITENCEGHNIDTDNKNLLERERENFPKKEEEIFDKEKLNSVKSFTEQNVFEEKKCSAQAELGQNSPWADEAQFKEFRSQLMQLGFHKGVRNPSGWVFRIIENILVGKPSVYLDEFQANLPLGSSEQREWEIRPGVVFPVVRQCVEQDALSKPGNTPERAAREAANTIKQPHLMAAVWESIKAQIVHQERRWDEQSALGVQTPALPPWLREMPSIPLERAANALQKMQAALPAALQPAQEMLLAPAVAQIDSGDLAIEPADDAEARTTAMAAVREKLSRFNSPGKRRF